MESWQPGSRFGELEIVREIGRGAFARVYLARDTLVGRQVALKLLRLPEGARQEGEREALLREARLVGRLRSPHVATLYRVHALPDGWVFELEYAEGGSLEDRLLRTPRLPVGEARRIVHGILLGLKAAHEEGVVHGDVKPGNVLFAQDGTVKLVDFGLANFVGEFSLRVPLVEVVGTPIYMAPELGMGEPATPLADLWSTGVVLYRMLSGRLPFAAKTLPALFYAIQNAEPPSLDAGLPGPLVDLALRCLSKAKDGRPTSCAEALLDLEPAAVADAPPRAAPARAGPAARLFGRHREQVRLDEAARHAAEGRGTTVLLRGEAGTGKSALAHDLLARAAPRGFRWIEARVTPLEGLLRPLLVGVRDLLGPPEGPGERLVESKLFGTATNLLRALLEEESPARIESRQQIFWGIDDLLAGLAEQGPLGILVEDVHQADAGDLSLLTEIARRLKDARVLLVIALRPRPAAEGLSDLAAQGTTVALDLAPLDAGAVARLLQERAQGARLAAEVLRRVLDVAEGNPLLTIEVFRHLQETGALATEGGVVVPGPAWGRTALPRRVRDLVLLRLRELSEDERAILDVAAVDGAEFEGEAVASALGRPTLDVLRTLQQIYRRTGLTVPRPKGYRFASAALQEGIYDELAPDLRRTLHRCLAEHLEKRALETAVPAGRLGLHWERAGEAGKARPHLLRAAREALQRQESLRAVDLARRAGLDAERLDPETAVRHADLLLELCTAWKELGRHQETEPIYARLLEGANSTSDVNLSLKVMIVRADTRYESRGLVGFDEEAVRHAARHLPPSVYQGRAWYLLGRVAKYRGDLDEAERCLRCADEAYMASGEMGRHSSALDQLGSVALRRGRWREAEALYGDAARISAVGGRRTNASISEVNRALAAFSRGALDGLEERLDRALRVLMREGAFHQAASAMNLVAEVRYALGNLGGAKAALDEALPPLRAERYLTGLIPATLNRAQFAAVEGSLDLGRQTLAETRRLAQLRDDAGKILQADLLECHLSCFAGDLADARRAARAALATAKKVKELPPRADALLWLAEAGVYGLPPEILREAEALVDGARMDDAHLVRLPLALARGARALAEGGADTAPMLEAARSLAGDDVGARRETLRALGGLIEAEARLRTGDRDAARKGAQSALGDCRALGHVWLAMRLRAFLARAGDQEQAHILGDEARRLALRLPAVERQLLLSAWLPPGPA
jgi:tetratricopeptide (TPR) repeat protein/tRNA A-37 threonylcarbamoyl transferase component Bud32